MRAAMRVEALKLTHSLVGVIATLAVVAGIPGGGAAVDVPQSACKSETLWPARSSNLIAACACQ